MLFDYYLKPVDEVSPWGEPNDLNISWFVFTEGSYRLNLGDVKLLNYSDEAINHWRLKYPDYQFGSDVDYYVTRLYEDITSLLPYIFTPIPKEFSKYMFEANDFCKRCESWLNSNEDTERIYDIYYSAVEWVGIRYLDTGYLRPCANTYIWLSDEIITIHWDNSHEFIDGTHAWSAIKGSFQMPVETFISELKSFEQRFMSDMKERVAYIIKNWNKPDIRVDFDWLASEQKTREGTLTNNLSKILAKNYPSLIIDTNWDEVLKAIEIIERETS